MKSLSALAFEILMTERVPIIQSNDPSLTFYFEGNVIICNRYKLAMRPTEQYIISVS